ncbi:hypothetical protein ACWF94_01790 [Streptomyces sp. NPDC055078]
MHTQSLSKSQHRASRSRRRVRAPLVRSGLWYELLLHRPWAEDEPERKPVLQEFHAPAGPRVAIRTIHHSVHATAARLLPRDRRALLAALADHVDGAGHGQPGDVHAVAALHRGQPVGFAFTAYNGEHFEWAVRAVTFLSLVEEHTRTPGSATGCREPAAGRGESAAAYREPVAG